MDDVTLSGDLQTVKKDIFTIVESCIETGLRLNTTKCEITIEDFTKMDGNVQGLHSSEQGDDLSWSICCQRYCT